MEQFANHMRVWLAQFAGWGILLSLASLLVLAVARGAAAGLWRVRRYGSGRLLILAPLVAVAVLYGGSKQRVGRVSFPYTDPTAKYFTDAGSRVDDDGVWLAFRAVGIPTSADFHGVARPIESTDDADWQEFLLGTVGQYITPQLIPFENAKAYDFQFFSTYTAGPTVHTNGVLNVKWGVPTEKRDGTVDALPINSQVRLDGVPVATPSSADETVRAYAVETEEGGNP